MSQIIKEDDYPVVVKVRTLSDKTFDSTFAFSDQQEVLLQKKVKAKFARVRTLISGIHGNTSKMLIQETGSNVCEECLIPVNYPGKLKFVHRPGSLTRFTSVSQVLQEMPLYVILNEDAIAFPTDGTAKNVIVPAKTKLKVIRKYTSNNTVYLECSDGKRCFAFSERDRVEFVEHEEKDSYQLCELVNMKLLPQIIRFEVVEAVDNDLKEEKMSEDLLDVMSGPLELVEFLDLEVIVGWVRNEGKQRFETVLIPNGLWESLHFHKMYPEEKHQASLYILRKYGLCLEAEVMGRVLFPISMNKNLITLLRAPNTEIEFEAHTPQTEPAAITLPTKQDKENQLKDRIVGRVKPNICQLGAGKKLDMITRMSSCSTADIPSLSHGKTYHQPKCRLSKSMSDITDTGLNTIMNNDDKYTESLPIPIRHKKTDLMHKGNAETIPVAGPVSESHSEPAYVDDYITMSFPVSKLDTVNIETTGNHSRLAASPKAENTQDGIDIAKDFFRYTVEEVSQCFSSCGLKKFGELCYENMLDGSFFRTFDMHYLKEDPFFLSPFEVLKVQKVVVEGWRPTFAH